ncbi:hypothetical protein [Achromobacter aloeverae]
MHTVSTYSPFDVRDHADVAAATVPMVRRLPFVELMELLEFDRLRLDPPPAGRRGPAGRGTIGTQEWLRSGATACAAPARESDVYICSTLMALHESILPPDDALLHFDVVGSDAGPPENFSIDRVRIRMVGSVRARHRRPLLRVDLRSLIQQVLVPPASAPDLFELVQRVVRSRIWVDVIRSNAIPGTAGSSPEGKGNIQ